MLDSRSVCLIVAGAETNRCQSRRPAYAPNKDHLHHRSGRSGYDQLKALYEAGTNVVRLNMSHDDHADHSRVIKAIRTLNR